MVALPPLAGGLLLQRASMGEGGAGAATEAETRTTDGCRRGHWLRWEEVEERHLRCGRSLDCIPLPGSVAWRLRLVVARPRPRGRRNQINARADA